MSDAPTLGDLIEELIGLMIDLGLWEEDTRPISDIKIEEIRGRIKEVKEAINEKVVK